MMQFSIRNGADVNIKENSFDTPLLLALQHGHKDTAMYLIDAGAHVKEEGYKGE